MPMCPTVPVKVTVNCQYSHPETKSHQETGMSTPPNRTADISPQCLFCASVNDNGLGRPAVTSHYQRTAWWAAWKQSLASLMLMIK
jgi:hypothetical protein